MTLQKYILHLRAYVLLAAMCAMACHALPTMAGEPFRFALLTDIHINAKETSATEDLRNSVKQINATDNLDFVLVTGDIADEGDRASLILAKQELDKLKIPYYIIMGNHDQKWSESGCMDFKHIFGYERFKFEHKGYLFLGFNCGPLMRMALGHVPPEDIDWVKNELEKNGKNGKPVFLVTHMPMLPQDTDNWNDVTDAVRIYPVKAFIGGHYHKNSYLSYDGIPGIISITNLRKQGNDYSQYNEFELMADSMIVYTHPVGHPRYRWTAISLTKSYYDTKPGSPDMRPDFSINREYPAVKRVWEVASRAGIYSSPVPYKGKVYVADNLGRLSCYTEKDGRELWTYRTEGRIIGTPAIGKGVVVAGSADDNIYGVDAASGKLRWKVHTRRPVVSAVTTDKNVAYVGGSDSTFRAIDVTDGRIVWENHDVCGYVETKPLVTNDLVLFGAWDNSVYALDKQSGLLRWKWTTCAEKGMHYSPAAVWLVEAHNKVFLVDPERAMTALDIRTGDMLWRTYQSKVRESIGLSADKRRIYAKTMQDSVVCYATDTPSAHEIWASNVGFGYEHATVMLTEKDGVVFSSTKNGLIFAVDARTGRVYWKHKIGNTLVNTVVPLSKTEVLYTNEDGLIGKLKIDERIYKN